MQRRLAMVGFALIAVAATAVTGCSTSGGTDAADDPTSTTERTTSTTAASTTTGAARSGGGASEPWSEVVEIAGARHGTVERMANAEDPDSGELLVPEMPITIDFDGDRQLIHATIEVPVTPDSDGGTLEYVIGPDVALMSTDFTKEECGADWVDMSGLSSALGTGLGELGSLTSFPMPPFDLIADHEPVEGTTVGGETSFAIEIPAALLVSEAQQRQYDDLAEKIEGVTAPAEVLLGPDGSLEVHASAPLLDILPVDPSDVPAEAEGYEMTGWWRLEPSAEPLDLTIPEADMAAEDCLNE